MVFLILETWKFDKLESGSIIKSISFFKIFFRSMHPFDQYS